MFEQTTPADDDNAYRNRALHGFAQGGGVPYYMLPEPVIRIPPRDARHDSIDFDLLDDKLAAAIRARYGDGGLYRSQAMALTHTLDGGNLVLTTGTGSGKSDVFIITALDLLLTAPEARVIVFYPYKALNHDQVGKWQGWLKAVGLPPETIARIDGSTPQGERTELLRNAKILMTTPDAFQQWFMPEMLKNDLYREFLTHTYLRVLDEAHAYDSILGTNMLHMLRRIDYHQARLHPRYNAKSHRRYLATSGTLPDPAHFFQTLTGVQATHIGDDDNGATIHEKQIAHVRHSARPRDVADDFFGHRALGGGIDLGQHQVVIFADHLPTIEELAARIRERLANDGPDDIDPRLSVLVYKAGLPIHEYQPMHRAINSGQARVIVASSAFEAGVDAPHLDVMIQLGLPIKKDSLLQRIGRVGRRGPSSVFVLNEYGGIPPAPGREKTSSPLFDYLAHFPLDTPNLYPLNRTLQIGSAFCLKSERTALKPHYRRADAAGVSFPRGFAQTNKDIEKPYDTLDTTEQTLIPRGRMAERPHNAFPLRTIPGPQFALFTKKGPVERPAGTVSPHIALVQYTPGMVAWHRGERVRVKRWEEDDKMGHTRIIMEPYTGHNRTKAWHRVSTSITFDPRHVVGSAIKRRFMENPIDRGFMAHIRGRLRCQTTGFLEIASDETGKTKAVYPHRYLDDHQLEAVKTIETKEGIDYGPRRFVDYPTAGILLHMPDTWFGENAREQLGREILKIYAARNRISPHDLGVTTDRISVYWGEGNRLSNHCLYFYETTSGGIGLLGELPRQMREILMHMQSNPHPDPHASQWQKDIYKDRVGKLLLNVISMTSMNTADLKTAFDEATEEPLTLRENLVPVFAPGDIVRRKGKSTVSVEAKILMPGLSPVDGTPGYYVRSVDRKQFFGQSGRWVTVSKAARNFDFTLQQLQIDDAARKRLLSSHFISAKGIQTDLKRPQMAMDVKTGTLYTIDRETHDGQPRLDDYEPQGDTRLLYEQRLRPRSEA